MTGPRPWVPSRALHVAKDKDKGELYGGSGVGQRGRSHQKWATNPPALGVWGKSQQDKDGGRTLEQLPTANQPLMLSRHSWGYWQLKLLPCGAQSIGVSQSASPWSPQELLGLIREKAIWGKNCSYCLAFPPCFQVALEESGIHWAGLEAWAQTANFTRERKQLPLASAYLKEPWGGYQRWKVPAVPATHSCVALGKALGHLEGLTI